MFSTVYNILSALLKNVCCALHKLIEGNSLGLFREKAPEQ